jgi:hypothetical protein
MPSVDLYQSTITKLVHYHTQNHLVEPFSLEFMLHTKFNHQILSRENGAVTLSSDVVIDATMPRLVFNFHSSSIRLLNRITEYRRIRKRDIENTGFSYYSARSGVSNGSISTYQKTLSRVDFNFSAPFIALNLIDDSSHEQSLSTNHLVELVFRGIRGQVSHTSANSRTEALVFSINLNGLYAKDLYQKAGPDFSMLVSSQQPDLLFDENHNTLISTSSSDKGGSTTSETSPNMFDRSDLFSLHFENSFLDSDDNEQTPQTLSITTNELYVEWNPETIACIQKSLRLTREEKKFFKDLKFDKGTITSTDQKNVQSFDNNASFFDALEDNEEYQEQLPTKVSTIGINEQFYSPVPTKDGSSYLLSPIVISALKASPQRSVTYDDQDSVSRQNATRKRLISVSFCLSKLRVRFNKESRFRRLVTAEMSETEISYQTKSSGCGATFARVGNFKMIDPINTSGSTLYGEIIGLQSEAPQSSSMLEISYETFRRSEDCCLERIEMQSKIDHETFGIDSESRCVYGSDSLISIRFSPMRFVYLQQLWMEIIDYFFEGILGDEVWGRDRPDFDKKKEEKENDVIERIKSLFTPEAAERVLPWADAFDIRFLRFNIFFDSPVIILPVEYKSPQHLRFDLSNIEASNWFSGDVENLTEGNTIVAHKYVQWFNNCSLKFERLRLKSWCGTQLNIDEDGNSNSSIPVQVLLKWPIGPTSFLHAPKWDIRCCMDKLR